MLSGKADGDLVTATIVVSDADAVLPRLDNVGTAPITDPVPDPPSAPQEPLLRSSDRGPDATLTVDSGAPWALAEWRGMAVALPFIYARYPLPQFCPLMDRRFGLVQSLVKNFAAR